MKTKIYLMSLILGLGFGLALLALLGGAAQAASAPQSAILCVAPGGVGCASPCNLFNCYDSVQSAVDAAASNDEIRVAEGKFSGVQARHGVTQVVYISKTITIRGGYTTTDWTKSYPLTQPTYLNAQRLGRVVYITGSVAPVLEGLIIANGNAIKQTANCPDIHGNPKGCGGGIFVFAANPTIINNIITNNIAVASWPATAPGLGYGGGLYLMAANDALIDSNTIISNTANNIGIGIGGGICLQSSDAQVLHNMVLENHASGGNSFGIGGGVSVYFGAPTIRSNKVSVNWINLEGTTYSGAALSAFDDDGRYLNNIMDYNHGESAVFLQWSRSRVERNRIMNNATAYGIDLFGSGGSGLILINNVVARTGSSVRVQGLEDNVLQATLLHNSLIGSNTGTGVLVNEYATLSLTNTIVVSHTWGITNTAPASSTVQPDHTLFYANDHNGILGTAPKKDDPAFKSDGYHLSLISAAIDVGASSWVTNDIDGDLRPFGFGADVGADELCCTLIYLPLMRR